MRQRRREWLGQWAVENKRRLATAHPNCFSNTNCSGSGRVLCDNVVFIRVYRQGANTIDAPASFLNDSSANVRNTHSLGFSVFKVSVIAIVTKAPAPCCSSAPQRTQVSLHRSTCSLVPILNESSACARTGVAGIPPAPVPAGDNLGREALQGEPEANRHQRLRRIPKQRGASRVDECLYRLWPGVCGAPAASLVSRCPSSAPELSVHMHAQPLLTPEPRTRMVCGL